MVTAVVPSSPQFLPSIVIAHRVQQFHCSSIFHRVLLTHALSCAFRKSIWAQEKSQRNHTNMHSAGLELTKLIYTRLEDNLIRHRGDRFFTYTVLIYMRGHYVPRYRFTLKTAEPLLYYVLFLVWLEQHSGSEVIR